MFENFRVFKTEFAGREMSFEVGKMCGLSNGSCLVHYGETTVPGQCHCFPEAP